MKTHALGEHIKMNMSHSCTMCAVQVVVLELVNIAYSYESEENSIEIIVICNHHWWSTNHTFNSNNNKKNTETSDSLSQVSKKTRNNFGMFPLNAFCFRFAFV